MRLFMINNEFWLGCYVKGKLYLVTYKGKAGDRISV